MLHALLCELEGVLADTHALRRRALTSILDEDGLVLHAPVFDRCCAGEPTEAAVRGALHALGARRDDTEIALLALRADRAFTQLAAQGVMLAPGARELVERAAGRVRLAVVSRAPRLVVERVLSAAGLDAAFACVIASEDAPVAKPAPHAHRAALARLARGRALDARDALALEDARSGIAAAHAAGLRAVAVGHADPAARAAADGWIASLAGTSLAELATLCGEKEEMVG